MPRRAQSHDHEPCRRATNPPDEPLSSSTSSSNPSPTNLFKALTYSSLVLENSGNLARDHLSIERTWLAYMRTSLLMAGTGLALVQLYAIILTGNPSLQDEAAEFVGLSVTMERFARPLGETIVILALCVMATAMQRYFELQHAVMRGIFPAARTTVVIISASLGILTVVIFGLILTLPA
ncbi:hypothetical protein JB92DRAFT_2709535 [Gautieria morchelliformis]|nr:hypothetical protein JB92DRAFT_2709535 [Gautieria morchelliformis]